MSDQPFIARARTVPLLTSHKSPIWDYRRQKVPWGLHKPVQSVYQLLRYFHTDERPHVRELIHEVARWVAIVE